MLLAGVVLGEDHLLLLLPVAGDGQHHEVAVSGGQGVLHRVGQAGADALPHDQAVHHDLNGVLLVLVQLDLLREIVDAPVHADADVALLLGVGQHLFVHTLLTAHHRGEHHEAGALGEGLDLVDDLIHGLLLDLLTAHGAVRGAHAGVEQTEVIVDLGDGTHRGAGVLGGGLLVDGDGGGQPFYEVYVGLVHLPQKHTGVGGQGLHETAVALGVDRVEGQGGLTRARESRHDHQLVPGDLYVDILQVVDAGALDDDGFLHIWVPFFGNVQSNAFRKSLFHLER